MENYFVEFGGAKKGFFRRNTYFKRDDEFLDKAEQFIDSLNNTDVYCSVYSYSSEKLEEALLYGGLYIDLDLDIQDAEDFGKIRHDAIMAVGYLNGYFKIPYEQIQIYFSGSKGFHVVVPPEVMGIEPDKALHEKFKALAGVVKRATVNKTVDTAIYDNRRLFRLPNSINSKTGLYKVALTYEQLQGCTLEWVREWASQPRDIPFAEPVLIPEAARHYRSLTGMMLQKKKPQKKKQHYEPPKQRRDLLPCIKQILTTGASKGHRNNTSVAVASSLFQSGLKHEEVNSLMLEWNEFNDPPLPEREIYTTIRSAYGMLANGKTFGCRFVKDMGLCTGNGCKVYSK